MSWSTPAIRAHERILTSGDVEVRTVTRRWSPLVLRNRVTGGNGSSKPIIIDGVEYLSKNAAKQTLLVSSITIGKWLADGRATYK